MHRRKRVLNTTRVAGLGRTARGSRDGALFLALVTADVRLEAALPFKIMFTDGASVRVLVCVRTFL